jgi:hypothetical protein
MATWCADRFRILPPFVAVLLLFALTLPLVAEHEWDGVARIVAVGDAHGDFDGYVQLLRAAGVIDRKNRWTAGAGHLVQLGDVVDRGPDSRKIMDLLMKLEGQAEKAKGRVHLLLGNHEAMNMYGDLRYVSPDEYSAFRSKRSSELRDQLFEVVLRQREQDGTEVPDEEAAKKEWYRDHPLGWVEHRLAFAPEGKYGKWLRKKNAVIRINQVLFVHGGISPKYLPLSLEEINERVREELSDFSKLEGGMVADSEGPLWYRGLSQEPESESGQEHVGRLMEKYGVKHVVVGHTPTLSAVLPRFGGRVVLIDVGLSREYGGPPACLIVNQSELEILHRGRILAFPDGDEELQAYLEAVAAMDPEPSRIWQRVSEFLTLPIAADP